MFHIIATPTVLWGPLNNKLNNYPQSRVSILRVSLLRVLESNFPGDPLSKFRDMRIPLLRIKSLLESNPLKPELLVGGLGVIMTPTTNNK